MSEFFSFMWTDVGWSDVSWSEGAWTIVWQTTLALSAGVLATAFFRRRPARADSLLVASIAAALAAPLGTLAVHQFGWGILTPHKAATARISLLASTAAPPAATLAPLNEAPALPALSKVALQTSDAPVAGNTSSPFAPRKGALPQSERRPTISRSATWSSSATLLAIWLALSLAALGRLGVSAWIARSLLAASRRVRDARIERALALAADRLKLGVKIEARISADVHCPVIWCWRRRPIILLPAQFAAAVDESAWLGIFCHELAHWKRRDHLSALAADLLRSVVPWQPLAWWAARRHAQLSELACDEWVLASGESPESYADSLLDLAPQRGAALALAVLRNRAGLAGRIAHILRIAHARPALGRRWLAGLAATTLACVALAALAQQMPLAASDDPALTVSTSGAAADATHSQSPSDRSQNVSGVVLDLSDKPVAGARVYWVGLVQDRGTVPHDDPRGDRLQLFANGTTDDEGRFTMSANFDARTYAYPSVVVRHARHGLGLRSYSIAEQTEPLKIHLPVSVPIQGQILNPNGMPVAGVDVLPIHLDALVRRPKKAAVGGERADSREESGWGWLKLSDATRRSGVPPSFWPQPVKTDADGRFTIPGGDNCGTALLCISAEGFGAHGVTVSDDEAIVEWNKNKPGLDGSPPLPYDFTLVLESPRTMEGTVTDARSGQPVAGVEIIMESDRDSGNIWNRQIARSASDGQGRYRFVVPATGRQQHFRIYPPLGYAPLGGRVYLEREFAELFGNGRVYRNDIQLTPVRVVHGRVVDADSRAPVREAAVRYSPQSGNPNVGEADYWFYEPVLTDDDGAFQITGFPGVGGITVDTRSQDHIRETIPPEIAGRGSDKNPHAFRAIDLPATDETPPLELVVHRGTDLVVEPVGPDGQPVAVVQVAYREAGVPATPALRSRTARETPLRLPGCAPGKKYRLLIGTPKCELGAVADVMCDPAGGPVKVSLQPTGGLRGKLVYADDTPAGDIHTFLHFNDDPTTAGKFSGPLHDLPFYNNVMSHKAESRTVTGASGEFEILGLVPGVYLYLSVNYDFASPDPPGGVIEAGKTLDLGEIVVKP